MSESGIDCLSAARTPLRSRVTAISNPAICLPSASKKKMFVCPTATPIMYTRRDERTTALAMAGSATSTSLMSAGRSMATDFPIPSGMKRDVASLAATWTTGTRASAAIVAVWTRLEAVRSAASETVRISGPVVMSVSSPRVSPARIAADAEAHDVDAAARRAAVVVGLVVLGGVRDRAQRQRQRADALRQRQRLRLAGRQFERRGLADDDLLAALLLDVLVDREHAHIG